MYNHNKAQQSKNRVHISWDILYVTYVSVQMPCRYFQRATNGHSRICCKWSFIFLNSSSYNNVVMILSVYTMKQPTLIVKKAMLKI